MGAQRLCKLIGVLTSSDEEISHTWSTHTSRFRQSGVMVVTNFNPVLRRLNPLSVDGGRCTSHNKILVHNVFFFFFMFFIPVYLFVENLSFHY